MLGPRAAVSGLVTSAVLVIGLLASSGPAHAAVRVAASQTWLESNDAAVEARRRAGRWSEALGLRMTQVLSSGPDDRFAETVAVFERAEPLPEAVLDDETRALARMSELVGAVVGFDDPEALELRTLDSGAKIVWARWIVDDLAYECVLAPSGETTSVVIMAVLADELPRQRAALDQALVGLEGVSQPIAEFSLPAWRWGSLALWLILAAGLHASMLAFVDRERDHRQAGHRAALLLLPVVVLGCVAAWLWLRGQEPAVLAAGTSVPKLLGWIGVWGLAAVAGLLLVASRFDRGLVRSAPASGAFASGTYSTADLLRSSTTRSGVRRGAGKGGAGAGSRAADPPAVVGSGSGQRIVIDDEERLR